MGWREECVINTDQEEEYKDYIENLLDKLEAENKLLREKLKGDEYKKLEDDFKLLWDEKDDYSNFDNWWDDFLRWKNT